MKRFITATVLAALALATAPIAGAYTDAEEDYIANLYAHDITNRDGVDGMVEVGWTVCAALAQGYTRSAVASAIYTSSQLANGVAGVDYRHAQAIVFYAEADLCSGV